MRRNSIRAQRVAAKLLVGAAPVALMFATPASAQSTNAGAVSSITGNGAGATAFSGAASNTAGADTTNITFSNSRTVLNWGSFNLNAGDTLNFVSGSNTDIVLNRVTGGTGTQINGNLNSFIGAVGGASGGNVWFIDPAGIAVGGNAVVNVGGLLLSTSGVTDADFFNDSSFNFSGTGTGTISVASDLGPVGQLTATNGAITLLGSEIIFNGRANASGSNALIGAKSAQVIFNSNLDAFVGITINEGASQNLSVGSTATFDAGPVASGGRTIIAAAGTGSLGQIMLSGISADRVDFVEGDVVIYSAANTNGTAAPRSIVSSGAVQSLVSGTAPNLLAGYITASAGNVDIRGAGEVIVDGLTASAGSVRIEAGGLQTINSSVSTGGDYTTIADDWTGGFAFNPIFTGGAGVGDFNITDTAGGLTIGGRTSNDDFRITTVDGSLTIMGGAITATGGNVELTTLGSGDISLSAGVTDTGADDAVMLNSAGAIWQTGGAITAGILTGSSVGYASLTGATNQVTNLGAFSAGAMALRDVGGLTIGNVVVDGGASTLDVQTTGTLAINGANLKAGSSGALILGGTTGTVLNSANLDSQGNVIIAATSGAVTSSGTTTIDAGDSVTFSNSALLLTGNLTVTAANNATFKAVDGGGALTVNAGGVTNFQSSVGATTAVGSITTDAAGTTQLQGTVRTSGAQTYNDAVSLAGATTLTSTGTGAITLGSTVDGPYALTVNTAGATTFNGDVGATSALTSVTTDAGGTNAINGNVSTTTGQTYLGVTTLGGNLNGGGVTFGGALTLSGAGTRSITSTAPVSFNSTIDSNVVGQSGLSVSTGGSGVTVSGSIGAAKALASLTTNALTNLSSTQVVTTGAQNYLNEVYLVGAGSKAFTSTAAGDINFSGAINAVGQNLTVNTAGVTTFSGGVGNTGALASITTDVAGSTRLASFTSTTGAQTFNDAVTLIGDTAITSSSAGAITFDRTVNGTHNLTVNTGGTTTFNGSVGATTALGALITDAAGTTRLAGGSVTTGGQQSYYDNVVLAANTVLGGWSFTAASISGSGYDLTLDFDGNAVINGATFLGVRNLLVDGLATLSGALSTSGTQTYNNAVALSGNTTLTASSSSAITFNSTVDGAYVLTANTGGATTFKGDVGGTTKLAGLTTDSAGTSSVAGDISTTGGTVLGDVVRLTAGDHLVDGSYVTFGNAVLAMSAADDVTLRALTTGSGAVSFNGAIQDVDNLGVDAGSVGFSSNNNRIGTVAAAVDTGGIWLNNLQQLAVGTVGGISGLSAANDISLNATGGLVLQANIVSPTRVSFYAPSGNITQAAGTGITSPTLDLSTGQYEAMISNAVLTGNNDVNELYGFAYGTFNFTNSGPLMVQNVSAAQDLSISTTGDMTVAGPVRNTHAGAITLNAGGSMSVNNEISALHAYTGLGNVTLTAGGLMIGSASASVIGNDIGLTADDWSGSLGTAFLQEARDLSITDTAGGLTIGAATDVDATRNIAISTIGGDLNIGAVDPGGSATLSSTGAINVTDTMYVAGDLTATAVGPITVNSIAASGGNTLLRSTGGAVSLGSLAQVNGNDVTLAAATTFSNFGGSGAINASNRWLVFSADPTINTYGGLNSNNTAIWNASYGSVDPATISGSRYVFAYQPTLTVTTLDISKVYGNDLTGATGSLYTVAGLQSGVAGAFLGDTAASAFSGAPLISSAGLAANADVAGGPYAVTASAGTMATTSGYALAFSSNGAITVTPRALTGTVTANNKTYDGTTAATGSVGVSGVLFGDDVSATALLAFADKNAGSSKTVIISGGSLSGADAGNYTLSLPASTLATIFQKALTGTVVANDKIYDGSTAATGSVSLSGAIAGDDVTAAALLAFADKNAGSSKTVTISGGSLSGADAGNYTLSLPASTLASIFQKALTGTALANNKTYDGTTSATGSVGLSGVVAGDSVTGTASFAFADKNAGTGKTVNVTGGALSGADAANYTLTLPSSVVADILQKALSGTVVANSKTYDGTTAATGSVSLSGVVAGDSVTGSASLAFADKNAGTGKMVNVSGGALSGADAGNYTLTLPASIVADILQKAISGSVAVSNKTYDGTSGATGSVTLTGLVAGDSVSATGGTYTFADKNAGSGKTVNVGGVTLTGADAGNYTLTLPASVVADILQKAITASVTVANKTYDGTTVATGSVALSGVVAGDSVGTTSGTYAFAEKNAGTGKTVNVTGVSLTGTDAGNYALTVPASAVADILQKALTASVTANGKTYDGTTAATGLVSLSGVVAGDSVTGSASLAFADKNAGTGKTVSVSGATLSGADAGNYTVTLPASAVADILQKALTANVVANNKIYDGTTSATGSVSLTGVVAGDAVTGSATLAFGDKNAGTAKTVTVSNGSLSGADAGNYTLALPAAVVADILQKAITGTISADSKTYDGTTAGSGSVALNGVVAGDSVGTTSGTFTFANNDAGTGKTVTVNGIALNGADAGNYTLTVPASAVADILKRAITVTADAVVKTKGDADPAFIYSITSGSLVAGDALTGALARDPGEAAGEYAILQGSLAASANYDLSFVGSFLTIKAAPASPIRPLADQFAALLGFTSDAAATPVWTVLEVVDDRRSCDGSGARDEVCPVALTPPAGRSLR